MSSRTESNWSEERSMTSALGGISHPLFYPQPLMLQNKRPFEHFGFIGLMLPCKHQNISDPEIVVGACGSPYHKISLLTLCKRSRKLDVSCKLLTLECNTVCSDMNSSLNMLCSAEKCFGCLNIALQQVLMTKTYCSSHI